jgi:DNA ligase-1
MHAKPHTSSLQALSRRRCLQTLAAWPAVAWLSPGSAHAHPDTPALQLALEAPPGLDPRGWLVSEKLDGARALWDGTRLRFRSGLPVAAPAWFTAALPAVPLDGELWLGRGRFEALSGLVRRASPGDEAAWRALRFLVFDRPGAPGPFAERHRALQALAGAAEPDRPWQVLPQQSLGSAAELQRHLQAVVAAGGEGLMLHRADALWQSGRSGALLKLRLLHDAEAQVLAHVPGRGRHAGRLGALRVRTPDGRVFHLGTGFSDAQREAPPPLGSWVTYSHRGHTEGGLPRFASFVRVREL